MTETKDKFSGRWLHHGEWHGQEFSHEMAEYDHDESPGEQGSTAMRHLVIDRDGTEIGVWVPANWTDQQAREALASNW